MSLDHEIDPPKSPVEVLEERLAESRAAAALAAKEFDAVELARCEGRIEAYDDAIDVFSRSRMM